MPLRFLLDECTRSDALWHAILQHNQNSPPTAIDVVRVGDPGGPALGTQDPELVEWAVRENRIIVSGDKNTLIDTHETYVATGHRTPGLLIVRDNTTIGELVEFLELVGHAGDEHEFSSITQWIPLE